MSRSQRRQPIRQTTVLKPRTQTNEGSARSREANSLPNAASRSNAPAFALVSRNPGLRQNTAPRKALRVAEAKRSLAGEPHPLKQHPTRRRWSWCSTRFATRRSPNALSVLVYDLAHQNVTPGYAKALPGPQQSPPYEFRSRPEKITMPFGSKSSKLIRDPLRILPRTTRLFPDTDGLRWC